MRLERHAKIRGEGGLALWIIVAALVGGALWFLYSSRRDGEKNARVFAAEVAQRVAVNYDDKYLHVHLSPEAQTRYLASYRERLLQNLRSFGPVKQPIPVSGNVQFSSGFFEPVGTFKADLVYANMNATLDIAISRGMTVWQINEINLTWTPPPTPTPSPTPSPAFSPSPTPSPTPEQKAPARRKRNR